MKSAKETCIPLLREPTNKCCLINFGSLLVTAPWSNDKEVQQDCPLLSGKKINVYELPETAHPRSWSFGHMRREDAVQDPEFLQANDSPWQWMVQGSFVSSTSRLIFLFENGKVSKSWLA